MSRLDVNDVVYEIVHAATNFDSAMTEDGVFNALADYAKQVIREYRKGNDEVAVKIRAQEAYDAAAIARATITQWTDEWQPNAQMRPLEDVVAEAILADTPVHPAD